jgi:hypothetical protein
MIEQEYRTINTYQKSGELIVMSTDMKASIWQPVSGIVGPCADIGFARSLGEELVVTMHFSLVRGLPNEDLRLQFTGALAMHWEDECPGFYPVPENVLKLKCSDPQWAMWMFPLQRVEGSELLEQFRGVYEIGNAPRLAHFLLISMNDLVHVIARSDVTAYWIPGIGALDT